MQLRLFDVLNTKDALENDVSFGVALGYTTPGQSMR